ncbi:MAG: ribbon-helix-helix domain-containing protein [Stappiaceae bacterium]
MGLVKKSFTLHGHRTSIALEREFWEALQLMASARTCALSALITQIDGTRQEAPLASSLRIAALSHFRQSEKR